MKKQESFARSKDANKMLAKMVSLTKGKKEPNSEADSEDSNPLFEEWVTDVWKKSVKNATRSSLKWNSHVLESLNFILAKTSEIADNLDMKVPEMEQLTKSTSLLDFQILVGVPVHVPSATPLYNQIMDFYTHLMKTFYALCWKTKLNLMPYFQSELCEFQDPLFRQMVRRRNLNDPLFKDQYLSVDFNIKEFILLCLNKFFPYEQSQWAEENHKMHLYSLKLFLESFEFGLWTYKEVDSLNEVLHRLAQTMMSFEQFVSVPKAEGLQRLKSLSNKESLERIERQLFVLYEIKKAIGDIHIHVILIVMDNHVESTLPSFKLTPNSVFGHAPVDPKHSLPKDELFRPHNVENNLFSTYLGDSIANYFFKQVVVESKVGETKMMDNLVRKVVGYLSDISADFYFHSIRTMNVHNMSLYIGDMHNTVISEAKAHQQLMMVLSKYVQEERESGETRARESDRIDSLVKNIKFKYHALKSMLAMYREGVWEVSAVVNMTKLAFKQLLFYLGPLKTDPELFTCTQTAFVLHNLPQLILSTMFSLELSHHDKMQKDGLLKSEIAKVLRKGALVLHELIRENLLAVSVLFQETPAMHLAYYSEFDSVGACVVFSKMLLNDFGVMAAENNPEFFRLILKVHKNHLRKVCRHIESDAIRDVGRMDIKDFVGLLLYSRLFRAFFKLKRSHSVRTDVLFMASVATRVLFVMDYFQNRRLENAKNDFFKQIDDSEVSFELWSQLSPTDQTYLMEEAMYQALSSFEFATKRFHYEDLRHEVAKLFIGTNKLRNFLPLLETARGQVVFKCISKIFKNFLVFNGNATFHYHSLGHGESFEQFFRQSDELEFAYLPDIKCIFDKLSPLVVRGLSESEAFPFLEIYFPLCFKFTSSLIVCAINKNFNRLTEAALRPLKSFLVEQNDFIEDRILQHCDPDSKRQNLSPIIVNFLQELEKNTEGVFSNVNYRRQTSEVKELCKELIKKILRTYEFYDVNSTEMEVISYTLLKENSGAKKEYRESKLYFHAKHRMKSAIHGKEAFVEWEDVDSLFDKKFVVEDIFYHEERENEAKQVAPKDSKEQVLRRLNSEMELLQTEADERGLARKNEGGSWRRRYQFGQFEEKDSKAKEFEWVSLFAHKYLLNRSVTKNSLISEALALQRPNVPLKKVVFYMQQRYLNLKAHQLDDFGSSRVMSALNIEDELTQNVSAMMSFFFVQFHRVDCKFRVLENNFLVDKFYMSLVMLIDYMMQNSESYREVMFEMVQKAERRLSKREVEMGGEQMGKAAKREGEQNLEIDSKPHVGLLAVPNSKPNLAQNKMLGSTKKLLKNQKVKVTLSKLLSINNILFVHLVKKNFIDESWNGLYRPFYLVSNFIQNLCEDNYVPFKKWFNKEGEEATEVVEQPVSANRLPSSARSEPFHSYLDELYTLVEHSLLNIEVFFSKDTYLSAQDKEEVFPIFARSIECLTEFINGGVSQGANKLYFRRMNVFVGIFFRVVDDLDSEFYDLKINVIVYLTALIETKNNDKIEFIARNFSVIRVWSLVQELMKRIYLKQLADLSGPLKAEYDKANKLHDLSGLLTKHPIRSCDDLLDFYKVHEEGFAGHQIIQVCIKLWVFINSIGEVVPRFAHFIEELKANSQRADKMPEVSNLVLNERESALVCLFLTRITVKIEIERHDPTSGETRLHEYIFNKKSSSFFVSQEMVNDFFMTVNVGSLEEKRTDFFKVFPDYDYECLLLKDNFKRSRLVATLGEFYAIKLYKGLLYLVTLTLNVLILVFYNNLSEDYRMPGVGNGQALVTIFSIIGFVLALLFTAIWLLNNYNKSVVKGLSKARPDPSVRLTVIEWFQVFLVWPLLSRLHFPHFATMALFYALGRFVSPLFFCLAMFFIADISETVRSIIKAFMKNWFKLMLGMLLIAICMNVYAYLLYDQFPFYFNNFINQRFVCDTYFKCLINTINLGLIHDKGVAAALSHVSLLSNPQFIGRFFFDVTFFLFITTILFQIIFGIIVDSYDEFQEDFQERENDKNNVCFVCGYKREEVEKYNLSFEDHTKLHNLWKYFFYYQYLKRTPSNDYNGTDIYVWDCIENEQLSWLPEKRTKQIEDLENLKGV